MCGRIHIFQTLHRMHETASATDEKKKIQEVMVQQVKMLQTYESIDGGWGYYDFNAQTKQPSGSSISFVNATGLVALKEANASGVRFNQVSYPSIKCDQRQRLPDHSYLYGEYLKYGQGQESIDPPEVWAQFYACNYALRNMG